MSFLARFELVTANDQLGELRRASRYAIEFMEMVRTQVENPHLADIATQKHGDFTNDDVRPSLLSGDGFRVLASWYERSSSFASSGIRPPTSVRQEI